MTIQAELKTIDDTIESLEARRRAIYAASLAAPAEEKVCDDRLAEMLAEEPWGGRFEWPIEVHGLAYSGETIAPALTQPSRRRPACGTWVAVRPCDDASKGKTFLGVYLGELALSQGCSFQRATGILSVYMGMHNPAIYVPELKRIVFGCGSWWGVIEGPEGLKKISDQDIENVWYVRALKELGGAPPQPAPRTLLSTLAEAAASWTDEEIEEAINGVAMGRAKRRPRG